MRRFAAILTGSATALLLCSCGSSPPAPAASSPTTTDPDTTSAARTAVPIVPHPPTITRQAKWVDLKVGDCLSTPPPTDPSVVEVQLTNCQAPHAAEVFLRSSVAVNDALAGVAEQHCNAGLAQYTRQSGHYSTTYLIDSNMDRTGHTALPSTVICLLQSTDGRPLTGSARD